MPEKLAQQMRRLPAERVWFSVDGLPAPHFDVVATRLGLRPLGEDWVEVNAHRAQRFLVALLRAGLAYGEPRMPEAEAERAADAFVRSCGTEGTRFATNASDVPGGRWFAWSSATDQTFDAGVAILGPTSSACYWVADED